MRRAAEALRWLMALAGLGFWLTGFWMRYLGRGALDRWYCRNGHSDECFNDYIPILETMVAPALVLLLAYPIARFVFTMWAPAPEARRLPWWPASRRGHADLLWPFGHALIVAGMVASVWTLLAFPLSADFWAYYLYWGSSACWCALTVWIAWPRREEAGA